MDTPVSLAQGRSSPHAGRQDERTLRLGPVEAPRPSRRTAGDNVLLPEPMMKARAASVYLSSYFTSPTHFLLGEKNANHFNVKLNSSGQSYRYSINTNIF